MKKLICFLVAAVLLTGAACAETVGNGLGFEVLRALSDGTENQVISPLSLAVGLAMAAQGAEGETRQEILDALGLSYPEEAPFILESMAETGMRYANAVFLTGEMIPREAYVSDLEQLFGAKWFDPEHSGPASINKWVEDVTDGMIPEIIRELPEEVQLVLLNAIAMDAKWQIPFDPNLTVKEPFFTPDGEILAEMMHSTLYADYGEADSAQLLRLGYRDSSLSMLIALPEEGAMNSVLNGLCESGLDYFVFREEKVKVELSMPKTDIAATNNLAEPLQTLGIEAVFSDHADLSGISEEMPLKVDSVLQKARLILDEEGTRAAAVTALGVETCAMPLPEEIVEFKLNRPFAVVVADEVSGAVCFAGIVANPIGN